MRMLGLFIAALVALPLWSQATRAAPPPVGSEDWVLMQDYRDWIAGLSVGGALCCSMSDGRPVQARMIGTGWQVRFRAGQLAGAPTEWTDVPEKAVHRGPNPAGVPIAWWADGVVRCFAPASGI